VKLDGTVSGSPVLAVPAGGWNVSKKGNHFVGSIRVLDFCRVVTGTSAIRRAETTGFQFAVGATAAEGCT
jgi:hypothetical protein